MIYATSTGEYTEETIRAELKEFDELAARLDKLFRRTLRHAPYSQQGHTSLLRDETSRLLCMHIDALEGELEAVASA